LFSAQNGGSIGWRVTNLSTGAQTNGSLTTNIPANTTFLSLMHWITNNATAAAIILKSGVLSFDKNVSSSPSPSHPSSGSHPAGT
jgi:hypothetical protein